MEFFRRAAGTPRRLAVFPGTFNPVTVAHLALARAALNVAGEVLFVLPRALPHKEFSGATFDERIELLVTAVQEHDRFSVAASNAGLFVDIAAECRAAYGESVEFSFLCGRDAAERIANWDYGDPAAFEAMLREFDLLVAARSGEYAPPENLRGFVSALELPCSLDHVSATEIRERIAASGEWEHLVPATVQQRVREIYTRPIAGSD